MEQEKLEVLKQIFGMASKFITANLPEKEVLQQQAILIGIQNEVLAELEKKKCDCPDEDQ